MSIEEELYKRSDSKCELCTNPENLSVYDVPPNSDSNANTCILVCDICKEQIENHDKINVNHWHCLKDSMWSQVPAVQVVVWRMLNLLSSESWSQSLLDMMYLDDDTLSWAKSVNENSENIKHVDSNGVTLTSGDTVVVIKDLNVKGAGFVVKRGTAVRNIRLVHDNSEHIEGKVNGQQIVILTKYVKKSL